MSSESVFHDFSYLETIEKALGSPLKIFLSRARTKDSITALAMFSRNDYKGLTLAPFTPYSPVWELGSQADQLSESLSTIFDKLAQINGRHHCHFAPSRIASISSSGSWTQGEYFTYHIDLQDGHWAKKYSKSLSRIVNKGRENVTVDLDNGQANLVCDFVADSYKKNRRNLPLELGAMKLLANAMIDQGLADVYLAKDRSTGEIKAGVVCLGKSRMSHYWMAGGIKGIWMTILIDELLKMLSKQSILTFDFLGANNPSIAEFKRRFGGEIVPYQGFHSNVGVEAKFRATISGIINK